MNKILRQINLQRSFLIWETIVRNRYDVASIPGEFKAKTVVDLYRKEMDDINFLRKAADRSSMDFRPYQIFPNHVKKDNCSYDIVPRLYEVAFKDDKGKRIKIKVTIEMGGLKITIKW